jgi:PAS domain S-box-containing protein
MSAPAQNTQDPAPLPFRRFLFWISLLYAAQVLALGGALIWTRDPGIIDGFCYALAASLLLAWGSLQARRRLLHRAVDALFLVILSADLVATLRSPTQWAAGIIPILAASLILPYQHGRGLSRRLVLAFTLALACLILHALIPMHSQAPQPFVTWYPVLSEALAVGLVLYALLQFHRNIQRDRGEREASRRAARESLSRYRQLIEASGQGVWIFDAEGRDSFVNERLLGLLGCSRGLGGGGVAEHLDLEARAALESLRRAGAGGGETLELSLNAGSGQPRRLLLSLSPMKDAQDQVLGGLGIFTDVSERRLLDTQLRQAARLEDVARLAGTMASELDARLGGVSLGCQKLDAALEPGSPAREELAAIQNAAARAAGLLGQLSAFSRKQALEPKDLDLGELIRSMRLTLERACGPDVSLSVDAPLGLGLVRADPSRLEQVLLNLAVNARDAMPQGGRLELRLDRTALPAHSGPWGGGIKGEGLRLRVGDNGTGIAPENLSRVFEPFFSTKGRGKGSGLGLATVYGIVRQSGGLLRLQSQLGRGTEAEIFLPLIAEAP